MKKATYIKNFAIHLGLMMALALMVTKYVFKEIQWYDVATYLAFGSFYIAIRKPIPFIKDKPKDN